LKKEDFFTQLQSLTNIKKQLFIIENKNFDNYIELAINEYTDNFYNKINQLLIDYPKDYLNKDGSKFWSGSKRLPHPIKYDANNNLCFSFVKNFAIILVRCLGVPIINDDNYIKRISTNIKITFFNQTKNENKNTKDNKLNEEDKFLNDIDDIEALMETILNETNDKEIKNLKEEINQINIDCTRINPEKFEKYDDSNIILIIFFLVLILGLEIIKKLKNKNLK